MVVTLAASSLQGVATVDYVLLQEVGVDLWLLC